MVNFKSILPKFVLTTALIVSSMSVALADEPCNPDPNPSPSINMVYGFGVEVVSFQEVPVPAPSDNSAGGA